MKVYFHIRTHLKCAGSVTFILLKKEIAKEKKSIIDIIFPKKRSRFSVTFKEYTHLIYIHYRLSIP